MWEISPCMKAQEKGDEAFLKALGIRIAKIREGKRMTQLELGHRCDIERANVSRIEAGNTNPTVLTLRKIASALDIPLTELIDVPEKSR